MIKFYVDRIKAGKLTLDKVPARWREAVREALKMVDLTGLTIAELCDLLHQVAEEIVRRWEESRVPKEDK